MPTGINLSPAIDNSLTKEETKGKEVPVVREITAEEGQKIVDEAATWEKTPYALVGGNSKKLTGGDCSGTTSKIYFEAGYPYMKKKGDNVSTGAFQDLAIKKPARFKEVTEPQAGDILYWEGHVAIYISDDTMWTAFNPKTKAPYKKHSIKGYGRGTPKYYRYLIYNGEPKW